jgi:DNA-binding response OmpR family regulator
MSDKKIAIVEDEAIVAMDISNTLVSAGYDVVFIVDSGEDAISKLDPIIPDLILIDVELKGRLNGIATVCEIRKKYNIPVIFLTGYEDEKILAELSEVSNSDYIIKPFQELTLLETIKRLIHASE